MAYITACDHGLQRMRFNLSWLFPIEDRQNVSLNRIVANAVTKTKSSKSYKDREKLRKYRLCKVEYPLAGERKARCENNKKTDGSGQRRMSNECHIIDIDTYCNP